MGFRAVRALRARKQEENSEFKRPRGAKAMEDAGATRSWSLDVSQRLMNVSCE